MDNSISDNDGNSEELFDFVFDDGTPVKVSKTEYRTKILPGMLERSWDDPAGLYSIIHQSLEDDLLEDILPALARVVAYLNLARAESYLENEDACFTALKKVIELDANMANPLNWYLDLLYKIAGAQEEQEELQRIAALDNNFYPKYKLGLRYLENGQKDEALLWFKQAMETESVDPYVLVEISSNMGRSGFIKELKEWMYPIFNVKKHDTRVALNLLNCCVELNDNSTGQRLLREY